MKAGIHTSSVAHVVEVRSSWTVEAGNTRPEGETRAELRARIMARGGRLYTCGLCGERGHSRRTCGQTVEERRAKRDGKTPRAIEARVPEPREDLAEARLVLAERIAARGTTIRTRPDRSKP